MNYNDLPVDTTVNDAVTFLAEAVADLPSGPDAVRTVKAELERLRTNNTRLGLLRLDAEHKVDQARLLVDELEQTGRGLNIEGESAVNESVDAFRAILGGDS